VNTDLVDRARRGDQGAFTDLVEPYRRELHVHCYRILGSVADAEDALQETLFSAWRSMPRFEGRASVRTWLYRIATNRCLNALRAGKHRRAEMLVLDQEPPPPTRLGDVPWLEPYPDALLEGSALGDVGPEGRYEIREAMSLAFVTALQLLPPRQRAVLVLRDVLGFTAAEVATMLGSTLQSVESARKRARAAVQRELDAADERPPPVNSPEEQQLVRKLVDAFEEADIDGIVALMTEDAWLRMPPVPLEYQGRELAGRFLKEITFRQNRRYRMLGTRANGQPALAVYVLDKLTGVGHAFGLFVITLRGERISAITRFDNAVIDRFGLPRTIEDSYHLEP